MDFGLIVSGSFIGGLVINNLRKYISKKIIARIKIAKLERKLTKTLYKLKYSDFKDTIYEITVLDNKYETSFLVKIKKKYFINDDVMDHIEIFKMKYDRNYEFKNYLEDRIERSISRVF